MGLGNLGWARLGWKWKWETEKEKNSALVTCVGERGRNGNVFKLVWNGIGSRIGFAYERCAAVLCSQ